MPSTLESCEEFFGTRDLYEIFAIDKKATVAEVKKAYYKKALLVHPDHFPEEEKAQATEKFKILAKVNEVLSDDSRRALYDEQVFVDDDNDDDDEKFGSTWLEAIMNLFKPIRDSDSNNYRNEYVGSDLEKSDLKKAYVDGRGCINYLMERMPFMRAEDEPRFHEIVNEWIKNNEVEDFPAFTSEPEAKRDRRHKKYSEDEQIDGNGLANQRSANFGSVMDTMKKDIEKWSQKEEQQSTSSSTGDKEKNPIKAGRISERKK